MSIAARAAVPKEEVCVVMMGSWGWWGPGVFFMIFCMGMMMWMMMSHGSHGSHTGESHGLGSAERILAERLARGEIDIEEYDRRLAELQRTSELHRT